MKRIFPQDLRPTFPLVNILASLMVQNDILLSPSVIEKNMSLTKMKKQNSKVKHASLKEAKGGSDFGQIFFSYFLFLF